MLMEGNNLRMSWGQDRAIQVLSTRIGPLGVWEYFGNE